MSLIESDGSKGQTKTMSAGVRRLQDALNMHLEESQKAEFVDLLNQFHISRNIVDFVQRLKQLLDTPAKQQIFPLIRKVIPKVNVEEYDRYLRFDGRKFDSMPAKRSTRMQRTRPPLSSSGDLSKSFLSAGNLKKQVKEARKSMGKQKDESQSDSSKSTLKGSTSSARSGKLLKSMLKDKGHEIKLFHLKHSGDAERGFGFSIRGGLDFGTGVFVSMVDKEGHAAKYGLLPGDQILDVNDISFEKITHAEAAEVYVYFYLQRVY